MSDNAPRFLGPVIVSRLLSWCRLALVLWGRGQRSGALLLWYPVATLRKESLLSKMSGDFKAREIHYRKSLPSVKESAS